ncbi:hypothetical protein [Streptomyces jumonjinensis]|uniref:hypothetical protein n=1 Tax=Streptomyces jumonjinensis TaxID=1945 RepID=UPI003792F869
MRSLLHGGPPGPAGPLFPLGAALPPAAAPTPEIAAGVLRPGMARAAGRTADTAVSYAAMLRLAGLDIDVSDPVSGARELVEEGVFLYGGPEELAARIRHCFASGIDEVVLNTSGVTQVHGFGEAVADLRDILAELSPNCATPGQVRRRRAAMARAALGARTPATTTVSERAISAQGSRIGL